MHHDVSIVISAMLTSCYFIVSRATLILYYHTFMLALHISLISHALGCHMRDIREVGVHMNIKVTRGHNCFTSTLSFRFDLL